MKDCSELEMQIEMRLHGALASATELDAHLAGCESCRAFEALAKSTELTMSETARVETQLIDWQALKEAVTQRLARDTRVRILVFAGVLVAQAVAMLAFNSPKLWARIFPNFGLISLVVFAVLAGVSYARARRLRAYESSREDILFFQRMYLEGRLTRTFWAAVILIPFGLSYIGFRIPRFHSVGVTEWLAAIMMTSIYLGIAAYLLFVVRPRLVRELDAFRKR